MHNKNMRKLSYPQPQQPKIIVILGPTASGKSNLAVELAKKFNGEIISADSRQLYKGMDIGTGKITKKEMCGIPHHLLDVVSPKTKFDVARYQKLAHKKIADILKRGKLPIVCGGTGLYIKAIVENPRYPDIPPDWKLRKKLEKLSAEKLFSMLKKLDRARAKTIDNENPHRLISAIEIAKQINNPRTQPANGESGAVAVCRQRAEPRLGKSLAGLLFVSQSLHSWTNREQSSYDGKDAVVRSVLTGGVTSDGINGETKPTFFILLEPLPTLNKNLYKNGIKLITCDYLREFAQAKTTNYILAVLLQKKLKKEKAFEVLYTWQDKVLECSTSNFFIFKGDTLITPKDNILIGITRNAVMRLAKEKFKIEERDIAKEELAFAT